MRSPFAFIVSPLGDKRYDSEREGITLSTSKEDARYSNRMAVVLEVPLGYDGEIEPGDILLVHHNVFKVYFDMKGRERSGRSYIGDGKYLIDPEQWFAYKKNGEWKTVDRYCLVKPVEINKTAVKAPGMSKYLTGKVVYSNEDLEKIGIHEGDLVGFTPDSEYEFDIDGETLYRMFTNNICIKYEKQS